MPFANPAVPDIDDVHVLDDRHPFPSWTHWYRHRRARRDGTARPRSERPALPPPMLSISPALRWPTGGTSPCAGTGTAMHRKRASCGPRTAAPAAILGGAGARAQRCPPRPFPLRPRPAIEVQMTCAAHHLGANSPPPCATGPPPPCGEGLGVGGIPTAIVLQSPPPCPSPTRGEGTTTLTGRTRRPKCSALEPKPRSSSTSESVATNATGSRSNSPACPPARAGSTTAPPRKAGHARTSPQADQPIAAIRGRAEHGIMPPKQTKGLANLGGPYAGHVGAYDHDRAARPRSMMRCIRWPRSPWPCGTRAIVRGHMRRLHCRYRARRRPSCATRAWCADARQHRRSGMARKARGRRRRLARARAAS